MAQLPDEFTRQLLTKEDAGAAPWSWGAPQPAPSAQTQPAPVYVQQAAQQPPESEPELPDYDVAKPGRWDVYDDSNRNSSESDTQWNQRRLVAAQYWAGEDAKEHSAAREETDKIEAKRERNRAAQARFRAKQRGDTEPVVIAAVAAYEEALAQRNAIVAQWDAWVGQKRAEVEIARAQALKQRRRNV